MFLDPEALTGKIMGGYQLKRIIGAGGAGTVYVGENATGEQVAVKVLLPAIRVSAEEMAAIRQRFQREAEVLARLRHPHILPLLAFDTDPVTGHFYMVMPLLPGGTLADRLNHGPLSFEQVSAYITQIASALDYAHEQNVIHRDIKPSNVLLDANDQAVLADFGIAKMVDSIGMTLTATGAILGTPEYMSLEQLQGNNDAITAATDVYGLGALAYHLLTDKKPYDGKTPQAVILAVAQTTPISPRTLRPDLPQPAEAVIMKALARRPEQRYATTGAFAAALDLGLRGIWPPREERPSEQPPTVAASVPFTFTPPEKAPNMLQGPSPLPGGVYGPPAYPPVGYGAPMPVAPAGYPPAGWGVAPPIAPPVAPPRRRVAPWIIGVAGVLVVALLAVLLRGVLLGKSTGSTMGQHGTSTTRTSATGTPSTGTSSYFTYTYKPPTKTGGTIAVGLKGSVDILNPVSAGSIIDYQFIAALWGSCAVQLPDLTLGSKGWVPDQCTQVPTVANSGESANGMTTTLHIDPKAAWSDGQAITANDYLLSYQIIKNLLGNPSPFSMINTVTAVDGETVQIGWQSPYAPYLSALWTPVPEHVFGAFSVGTYTNIIKSPAFNTAFTVDSGAYTLAQFVQGQSFTLKANKRYHSNSFHGPFLDQISVTMNSDANALIAGFKAGQFDHVDDFALGDVPGFTGVPQNEQIASPQDSFAELAFDLRDAAPSAAFSNDGHSLFGGANGKLVRKAFTEAFDLCSAFATILHAANCHDPNLSTAESVAPPDLAYDASITLPAFNVQQAQADLAAAGYPGGKNKNGTQVQVTIVNSAARGLYTSFASLMQQEWGANLGIKVNTAPKTAGTLFGPFSNHGILATGAYDLAIFTAFNVSSSTTAAADDDDITNLIEGDQIPSATNDNGGNYMGLQDTKIDGYLAQGRTTLDDTQRKQIYHDLFAYLASLYVLDPLFIIADYSLTKPTLGNYLQQPLGQNEWNIADWWTTS